MAEEMNKKNPILAGLMSAIVIGTGHFYLRFPVKALSYMAMMSALIVAQVHAERTEHHVIIALLMSAFYFFQIYDAYQDAKLQPDSPPPQTEKLPSKWVALTLVSVGILIQLSTLGFVNLHLRDIFDLWPLVLIFLGLRMATKSKNKEQ